MLKHHKIAILLLVLVIAVVAGCSSNKTPSNGSASPSATTPGTEASQAGAPKRETPYLEVWAGTSTTVASDKTTAYSKFLVENTGIGITSPIVPWEGGSAYIQRLNTRIATGNLPDIFLPWGGNEATLIAQGAVADLTDYLPEYAPNIWKRVPQEIWNIVGSADPSGEGKIYYIPWVNDYTYYGAFIRKDWLDNLGLSVPATQEEYVEVLKAFRDKDANGNGDPMMKYRFPVANSDAGWTICSACMA